MAVAPLSATADETLQSARKPGSIDRVTISLKVGGERKETDDESLLGGGRFGKAPSGSGQPDEKASKPGDKKAGKAKPADKKDDAKAAGPQSKRTPVNLKCDLQYDEKTLEMPGSDGGRWRSVRSYDKIEVTAKIGDDELHPTLRPERRLVACAVELPNVTVFAPRGPLTMDELEIADLLGNSLIVETLLPNGPIKPDHSWELDADALAALLGLDKVTDSSVACTVTAITPTVVRFDIVGKATGQRNDIVSQVNITGKYRFDLRLKRIDWLGLLVEERRAISAVEVGFDVTLQLDLRILPQPGAESLGDDALKGLTLEPNGELMRLAHVANDRTWQLLHDRHWFVVNYHHDMATLRLIDRGEFVAQCVFSPLPNRPRDQLPTLADFQEDVRKALDKRFGAFISAAEKTNAANCRVFRIAARGGDADAPAQWRYYHIASPEGRQMVVAFTVEEKLAERLDKFDDELIAGFTFLEPPADSEKKPK
jgi:hypothetical protein